jgi:hypothetical protein
MLLLTKASGVKACPKITPDRVAPDAEETAFAFMTTRFLSGDGLELMG